MAQGRKNTKAEFWSRISIRGPHECWPWMMGVWPKGYGRFSMGGQTWFAHRLAWVFLHGPIPKGKHVCHSCDNPPCCNPRHLWLGTLSENTRDRDQKGRCARGEKHYLAKLTEMDIRFIRHWIRRGFTQASIAAVFGITPPTVSAIHTGYTWKHV